MYKEVYGMTVLGLCALPVLVETDAGPGLPVFEMSGLLSNEVKEAKERVRTAIKNSGFVIKPQKIIINYSPANIRKTGTGLDLPTAVCILYANEIIHSQNNKKGLFVGELGLDGKVKPVKGCMISAVEAKKAGFDYIVVPKGNEIECSYIDGINIYAVKSLQETVKFLNEEIPKEELIVEFKKSYSTSYESEIDFADIKGQESAKRATTIAVSGMHNILFIGSPGCGKSMLAKRIPTIMPHLTYDEEIELTKIYSISNKTSAGEGIIKRRPFRSPGSTISGAALIGGGSNPEPGEITLASKGVLFLDELTQYSSSVIESLRQPLEDKKTVISRVGYSVAYPADFMLAAAMNPCKCGYYPDRRKCRCTAIDIQRYIGKLSRPIIDRFDLCIHMEQADFNSLYNYKKQNKNNTSSAEMMEKVEAARFMQQKRFEGSKKQFNAQMSRSDVEKYCQIDEQGKSMLELLFNRKNLTARGCDRILKTARTIADMEKREEIRADDIAEAAMFRVNINGGGMNG